MCEADIQRLDAKLRHEQDTATLIGREKERLEREEQQQLLELRRLKRVTEMVDSCKGEGEDSLLGGRGASGKSLEELEMVYEELSTSYREEYVMYNLAAAAVVQLLPLLKVKLRGWQPLAEPSRAKSEFQRLRPLLESAAARGPLASAAYGIAASHTDDPYMALVSELVLPPLRSACTGWEPREPEPLLTFLDEWEPLLPPAALGHVLEMLVMPKLRKATGDWEPRLETVPVHAWLHPWLPHLGSQLEELYPGIRHKLTIALQVRRESLHGVH
jgi:tuftelin-interacting protein 11